MVVLFAGSAGGSVQAPLASSAGLGLSVKTFDLPSGFKTPWQVSWIPGGSKIGIVAFTDRTGNQVGLLDPSTGRTQTLRLNAITNPNPIAVIDQNRFAIAGTGGVGIFDRSGTGTIRELQMAGTRNTVLALGPDNRLFVADAQSNDIRVIKAPFSGPADITKFPLPAVCRGPTGLIPGPTTMYVLCGQTNNIVFVDRIGNLLRNIPLKTPNAGAQEARPSPTGFVFSGFNANRVTSWGAGYPDPYNFLNVLLSGPAVPTVGFFDPKVHIKAMEAAALLLAKHRRPQREFFFNTVTPSYRGAGISFGAFRSGAATRSLVASGSILDRLQGKNLVGSTIGPAGSIFLADATPGKPALHQLTFLDPKATRTSTGYRYKGYRLTAVDPEFLQRIALPFFGPGPLPRNTPPKEVQVGIVGASSSPWNLKSTFTGNFDLKITAIGSLSGGRTYKAKAQSADTGAYTRVLRITNIRANTSQLTLELRGKTEVPVTFLVNAKAIRG